MKHKAIGLVEANITILFALDKYIDSLKSPKNLLLTAEAMMQAEKSFEVNLEYLETYEKALRFYNHSSSDSFWRNECLLVLAFLKSYENKKTV